MEIQNYLRTKGIASIKDDLGISTNRHNSYPNLVLFKYHQIDSPTAHPVVVECRGIILDEADNWNVVARPYDRFFNYGDGHAATIDWNTAKVLEKLDGSLMTCFFYNGKWNISSSGLPDASGQVNQETGLTFADLFWQTWNALNYKLPESHFKDFCFMFELMAPENRIIVPHTQRRIVLHGIRSRIEPYQEFFPDQYKKIVSADLGWEIVPSYSLASFEDVEKAAIALNPMQNEGFVVVSQIGDGSFHRVKMKSPQYVALAHIKDNFTYRRMIDLVRTNEFQEFLIYFPEMTPIYNEVKTKFDTLIQNLIATYDKIKDIPVQKDFALQACKCKWSAPLFAVRNGKAKSIREFVNNVSAENIEQQI